MNIRAIHQILSGHPFISFTSALTALWNSQKSIKKYAKGLYFDFKIAIVLGGKVPVNRLGAKPPDPMASGGVI